jgi:hypothetical protein
MECDKLIGLKLEIPWCETWVLTTVPDKWVRASRRPADLSVDPTDLVGGPHDLLKALLKIT